MIEPEGARTVKLVAAILWSDPASLAAARAAMVELWGEVDYEGPDRAFDLTDYYASEMGTDLSRRLVSFRDLIGPERIVPIKRAAASIEGAHAPGGKRRVNIDVGYLDPNKLVLASFKYGAMKVYLGDGIWADTICLYRKGRFVAFEWSFADFRDNRYAKELLAIRERYRVALRDKR